MSKVQSGTSPIIRQRAKELRKQLTPAESKLWDRLRNRHLGGYKFRRQCPIGPFIADFYCPECRLVIEVDGGIHELQADADHHRSQRLYDYNYRVFRVRNEDIDTNLETVLDKILSACQENSKTPLPELGEGPAAL